MIDFLMAMAGSGPVEYIAVLCGLANIVLIIRRSIWNYPFGFVMVSLYAFIFFEYKLYSDAILQVYFFLMQIYGLYCWLNGRGDDGAIMVERMPVRQYLYYGAGGVIGWLSISMAMGRYTDADFPFWDAAIATLSVIAQYLMSRRLVESWVLWVAVDVLAIGLFSVKGLYPTAVLYVVFLILASFGLFRWWQALREGRAVTA